MATILHLSDLHLFASPREQEIIFDELVAALEHVREHASTPIGLLAITGDVFDSAAVDVDMAAHRFEELHKEMCRALGRDVPTVIVPGNHDRRRNGLFGPHRSELFTTLRKVLAKRAWVAGCNTPFLSEIVAPSYHGGKTHYRVLGGVLRTLAEAKRVHGDRLSPFAYVALLNRYASELAQLTLRGLGDAAIDAFASATDLGTGLERPEPIERGSQPGEILVRAAQCPPRTLLRIYWRLDRA